MMSKLKRDSTEYQASTRFLRDSDTYYTSTKSPQLMRQGNILVSSTLSKEVFSSGESGAWEFS
jgi:hypothetical protein